MIKEVNNINGSVTRYISAEPSKKNAITQDKLSSLLRFKLSGEENFKIRKNDKISKLIDKTIIFIIAEAE